MKIKKLSFGKLALLIFFAITIPIAIQNIVYFVQAETRIRTELVGKIEDSMDDKAKKITSSLNNALALAVLYRKDERLYRYMDQRYESAYDFLVLYQDELLDMFRDKAFYSYRVAGMKLYTTNDTIMPGVYIQSLPDADFKALDDEPTYLNMQNIMSGQDVYLRICETQKSRSQASEGLNVSILCALDYYDQYRTFENYIKLSLDLESFKQILRESNLLENMYIADDAGRILVAGRESKQLKPGLLTNDKVRIDGYPVMRQKLEGYPLYLYGVYDDNVISQGFTSSRRIQLAVTLISVIITLTIIYCGIFSVKRHVFALVDQSQLIQLELEKETNKAKLLALQSQVNPHFMFNALESIRLKAMIKGEKETATMIKHMAKMFRHMINWEDNLIPLREEMTILEDFLCLQKYRFEDEFTYELTVEENAWNCLIPRMLLQPLVENASIHGMEASSSERWIHFHAMVQEGFLVAVVEDSGGGISPQKLQELRDTLYGDGRDTKGCVGLANVYRRLKLYYGDDFSFDIDSEEGTRTTVTVRIPEVR